MKNAQFRHFLEREFLSLAKKKKGPSQSEFKRYLPLLLHLHDLNVKKTLLQEEIYTAAYGDLGQFVKEFTDYVCPVLKRAGKSVAALAVPHTRTYSVFSPHLVEIVLGSMMLSFLCDYNCIEVIVSCTKSHTVISLVSQNTPKLKSESDCIQKVARLHGGRAIFEFSTLNNKIHLYLPLFPQFQPLKIVPCQPELCRICRIWNFKG
ncbi:MAG: hypothetical protein IKU25_07650 [Clostridia bacterium]|nr:hypothetical protein [Clostridia bacterium]